MLDPFHSVWEFSPGMVLPTFRPGLLPIVKPLWRVPHRRSAVHLLANPNLVKLTLKIDNNNNSLTTLHPKCEYLLYTGDCSGLNT